MEKRDGWKRIEWVVIAGCVTAALMTLGAAGDSGRGRAKEAVCQANLHRWGDVFGGILNESGGKFLSGTSDHGYWWPIQLPEELQDWKRNRTWFCPTATMPMMDETGRMSSTLQSSYAWGIYQITSATYQGRTYYMTPNGISGSYGLNGYVIPIPETERPSGTNTYERGVPAMEGWGNLLETPDAGQAPMFLGSLRFDVWPLSTDAPAPAESAVWTSNHMANCSVNRHDGTVDCLFVDGSVRKVGLKELWTLKWHRSFDTAGPWTKAGGVLSEDWPEWMRAFKDY